MRRIKAIQEFLPVYLGSGLARHANLIRHPKKSRGLTCYFFGLAIPSPRFPPIAFSTADKADCAKSFLAGRGLAVFFLVVFFIQARVTNSGMGVNTPEFQTIPVPNCGNTDEGDDILRCEECNRIHCDKDRSTNKCPVPQVACTHETCGFR